MKKIITFLFCTTLLASAFAQRDDRDWNHDHNKNVVYEHHDFDLAQRNIEIARVTNQYDRRIEEVSCDRSLSHRERKFAIRALLAEKAEQLNNIYARYSNVYNDHHGRDYRDHDYR